MFGCVYTENNGVWSIIIKGSESGDILRIPEKQRKCRYAKISQILEAGQFCRYVGDLFKFKSEFNINTKLLIHT